MLEAILWGLVQGLTEFLPISSSGHLVLVPAVLGLDPPDLATSAVLHLGTLAAVLVYFRTEVSEIVRFTSKGKLLLRLLVIGSIPAVVLGLAFESRLETINDTPRVVAGFLIAAGVVFVATRWIPRRSRTMEDSTLRDAFLLGLGQALALIPGVSRSGSTISTGPRQPGTRSFSAFPSLPAPACSSSSSSPPTTAASLPRPSSGWWWPRCRATPRSPSCSD